MKKYLIILWLIMFSVMAAGAQTRTRGYNAREEIQRQRIHQGVGNGELTPAETRMLVREQRRIHRTERRGKTDGVVSPREKVRLNRKQDQSNRHIRRAKHNGLNRNQ